MQALNRLENAKLVRYEQNKGFFVAEITEGEIIELFQVREALETYLVPTLIENLSEGDLVKIRERLFLKYKAEYLAEDSVERVLSEHRELLQGLHDKDTERAINVTRDHIRSGLTHMLGNFKTRRQEDLYWETSYGHMLSVE